MRRRASLGFTLVETSVTLGIVGLLVTVGVGWGLRIPALDLVQSEVQGALHEAKMLARHRGRSVSVALQSPDIPQEVLALRLPRQVRWGKPEGVPLPAGMADPVRADATGTAHARITFCPRGTATATSWFLHQDQEVLCVRMSGEGRWRMLRWRPSRRTWERV